MRIAIVSGSFRPGFSYQENIWAEHLMRRGEAVRVFTTGIEPTGDAAITVVPSRGLVSRNLYLTRALAPAVRAFGPELILWFGPPQLFGVDVARDETLAHVPLIAFMGQNRQMHTFDPRDRHASARDRIRALAYRAVRAPAVRLAMRRARCVVTTTPETADIVLSMCRPAERATAAARIRPTPLGFDPDVFGCPPDPRPYGGPRVVVSSRFAPEKRPALDLVADGLACAMERDPDLHATWVGFDGGPTSQRLGARLSRSPHAERMHRAPFGDRVALARHFAAADIAIFARASISAQEAMGTGLYVLLADGGAMDWLLTGPDDGALFTAGSARALGEALIAATERLSAEGPDARAGRAARARRLGYDRIIDAVLSDRPLRG